MDRTDDTPTLFCTFPSTTQPHTYAHTHVTHVNTSTSSGLWCYVHRLKCNKKKKNKKQKTEKNISISLIYRWKRNKKIPPSNFVQFDRFHVTLTSCFICWVEIFSKHKNSCYLVTILLWFYFMHKIKMKSFIQYEINNNDASTTTKTTTTTANLSVCEYATVGLVTETKPSYIFVSNFQWFSCVCIFLVIY